jgi:hypothetical protein
VAPTVTNLSELLPIRSVTRVGAAALPHNRFGYVAESAAIRGSFLDATIVFCRCTGLAEASGGGSHMH